jgi:predicted metalloprotease with PDZ domain
MDWAAFLHDRVDKINPRADLAGIEHGGYKLVYQDKPTDSEKSLLDVFGKYIGNIEAWFSIGLRVNNDGSIADVRWNSPADKAHLVPGSKIIGLNGQVFSGDVLHAGIREAKGNSPNPFHRAVRRLPDRTGYRLPRRRAISSIGADCGHTCLPRRHY